ncbi:acyl-ACP thioesterase [Clostridia bacterium]|nr:acyl-ACP thioesterase [Clostridia bacterium]
MDIKNTMDDKWYSLETVIPAESCGADGCARLDAWFPLFQWIASEHCEAIRCGHETDLPNSTLWILYGAHTEWTATVRAGDRLTLASVPTMTAHGMYQRSTVVTAADGKPVASHVGYWTLMDRATRKRVRNELIEQRHIDAQVKQWFRPIPFERLDAPDEPWAYTPGEIDIDENGHVNNARYIHWLSVAMGSPSGISTLDVWYSSEIMPGENITGRLARLGERFTFEVFRAGEEKAAFTATGTTKR